MGGVIDISGRVNSMTKDEVPADLPPGPTSLSVEIRVWSGVTNDWKYEQAAYSFEKIQEMLWSESTLMIIFNDNTTVVHPIHTIQKVRSY